MPAAEEQTVQEPSLTSGSTGAQALPASFAVGGHVSGITPSGSTLDGKEGPSARDVSIGKWLHKHRGATDGVAGYLGYQIVRNTLAAIPYGVATAATWLGMETIAKKSEVSLGNAFTLANPLKSAAEVADHVKANPSMTMRVMRSPIRDVAMIAAGFTLFRGTLKIVRYMKERLFNPEHTEAQAISEVQHFGKNLKDTFHEVAPAEVAATPAAAFALGYIRRLWNPALVPEEARVMGAFSATARKTAEPWQRLKNVFGKKGNYLGEAAILVGGFVPFFELGDRRYKDAQVARGVWLNDPSSLVRKSQEQAQAEIQQGRDYITRDASLAAASNSEKTTEHHALPVVAGQVSGQHVQAVSRSALSQHATGHLRPSDTPTWSCFLMRRVIPTAMGITAYVAGKRLAYLGMGTMSEHNVAGRHWLKNLGKMSLVEGAATSLFCLNAAIIDKAEPWYDKHFKDNKAVPMNDMEIRKRYEELQARLDAKEQSINAQSR